MRYDPVRNYVGGTFVAPDVPLTDVYNPSSGFLEYLQPSRLVSIIVRTENQHPRPDIL